MKYGFLGKFFSLLFIVTIASSCEGQTITNVTAYTHPIDSIPIRFSWSEPLNGTKVIKYIIQHKIGESNWYNYAFSDINSIWIDVRYSENNTVRVAGIDSQNRQGPWSENSNILNPSVHFKNKEIE